jgi:hypothetical protein
MRRRGIMIVICSLCLVIIFAFVAFSVETGRISLAKTEMQNAADAAALAASQEIVGMISESGTAGEPTDANSISVERARDMAFRVADANGVYIDVTRDVRFGRRSFDPQSGWTIHWGSEPYNVVQVTARRDNEDLSQPDGKLQLAFGWAVGRPTAEVVTTATAFLEARDLVLVLDYSGSMNDDSSMRSFDRLGQTAVEDLLDQMWNQLVESEVTWKNTSEVKFPAEGFGLVNSAQGTYISSTNTDYIFNQLGLGATDAFGKPLHPYPQAGRNSDGTLRGRPSASESAAMWKDYIRYVKAMDGPYRKDYGYRTLMDYMQEQRFDNRQSEDLFRTSHYPFHAVKEGASLFLEYVRDLDFGDEVGLVTYGGYAQVESMLDDGYSFVDISTNKITSDYSLIDTIHRSKQAGHYDQWTGMGYAIKEGRMLLLGNPSVPNDHGSARYGARPTMVIMTDGNTNQAPNFSLPNGFSWAEWTDYDNDGSPNYTTNDAKKQYAFWEATEAARQGITLHTLSVGVTADHDLMQAIAFAGQGKWIKVPGDTTVAAMEADLLAAFGEIASTVPPAKLIHPEN